MEKEKKSFNLIKLIESTIKPKSSSEKNSKLNHTPSWMYRNE